MLFVKLYVGVFHIFGGRFIVYDVEIKCFSSRFYSAVLGRKPLTCSHESSLLDRRWGPPGRGACPFGSPAPPPPAESGCFPVTRWPRKLTSSLGLSDCGAQHLEKGSDWTLRTLSHTEVVQLPVYLTG